MKPGDRCRVGVATPRCVRFKPATIVGEHRTAAGELRFKVKRDDGRSMPNVHPCNVHPLALARPERRP